MSSPSSNAFSVLGLPVRYDLNEHDLQARYHSEMALWHPDRATTSIEKAVATQRSRILNEAYQRLMHPIHRGDEIMKAKSWKTTPPEPIFFGWVLDQDHASFQSEWNKLAKEFEKAVADNDQTNASSLYGRMCYIWPRLEGR